MWGVSPHILAIITVEQLPPIESLIICVSFEWRYGICTLCLSAKAITTYKYIGSVNDILNVWILVQGMIKIYWCK